MAAANPLSWESASTSNSVPSLPLKTLQTKKTLEMRLPSTGFHLVAIWLPSGNPTWPSNIAFVHGKPIDYQKLSKKKTHHQLLSHEQVPENVLFLAICPRCIVINMVNLRYLPTKTVFLAGIVHISPLIAKNKLLNCLTVGLKGKSRPEPMLFHMKNIHGRLRSASGGISGQLSQLRPGPWKMGKKHGDWVEKCSPWYRWPIEIDGFPIYFPIQNGGSFRGDVSHNQRVYHMFRINMI